MLLNSLTAQAFTQGNASATSTGNVRINLPIGVLARISSLQDFVFPAWDGTSDQEINDDICVAVNTRAGNYMLAVAGDGIGGAFTLREPGGTALDYQVYYNDQIGTSGQVLIAAGGTLTGQSGASKNAVCKKGNGNGQWKGNGGGNGNGNGNVTLTGNIAVKINAVDLAQAPAGSYSGVLTLTLIPE